MDTRTMCRESAASALDLAQRATNSSDKDRLLRLAEKWVALAERNAAQACPTASASAAEEPSDRVMLPFC